MKKVYIVLGIILVILLPPFLFGLNYYYKHNTEFKVMQLNWKINLPEHPISEEELLDNSGGFLGDGDKIIKFTYGENQIEALKNSLSWGDYELDIFLKLNRLKEWYSTKDEKKFTELINSIIDNSKEYKFYTKTDTNDTLILVWNIKTNEVLAFIEYM
jgi:hypothetical protein